jgi:GT2 family glycosyltransferase
MDPDVTIIMPIYKPDPKILNLVDSALANQKYDGKITILKINKGGFGQTFNYGIQRAKTEIVISLHQDCVPVNDTWLKDLVAPLKDKNVVASASKVELPFEFWNNFDPIGKILSAKEQKVITPALDQKGCANKKSALLQVGLFDNKHFTTAGEDTDMYFKLIKIGKIAYPETKVIYYHNHTYKNRFKKELQLSNSFGALVRLYGIKIDHWYIGLLKSIPILGWPLFLLSSKPKKIGLKLFLLSLPIYLWVNLIYSYGFWQGYLNNKQTQLL